MQEKNKMKIKQNLLGLILHNFILGKVMSVIFISGFLHVELELSFLVSLGSIFTLFVIASIIGTTLSYNFYYLEVLEDKILVHKGFIIKSVTTVPFMNISTISTKRSIINYLTKCKNSSIETNDTLPNHKNIILSIEDNKKLIEIVRNKEFQLADEESNLNKVETETNDLNGEVSHSSRDILNNYSLSNFEIFKYSLAHPNSQLVTLVFTLIPFLIIFTPFLNKLSNFKFSINPYLIMVIVAVVFVLGLIISFISNVFKYFNYTIKEDKNAFIIEYGLFNRNYSKVQKKYINGLNVKASLLDKAFGLRSIDIINAGYGDSSGSNQDENCVKPIFMIGLNKEKYNLIMDNSFPEYGTHQGNHRVSKSIFIFSVIVPTLVLGCILAPLMYFKIWYFWPSLAALILFFILLLLGKIFTYCFDSIACSKEFTYLRHFRFLTFNKFYIKNKGILQVRKNRGPILRCLNRCNYLVNTFNDNTMYANIKFYYFKSEAFLDIQEFTR